MSFNSEDFDVQPRRPILLSEELEKRWRSACAIVNNHRRRFRMVANLANHGRPGKTSSRDRKNYGIYLGLKELLYRFLMWHQVNTLRPTFHIIFKKLHLILLDHLTMCHQVNTTPKLEDFKNLLMT